MSSAKREKGSKLTPENPPKFRRTHSWIRQRKTMWRGSKSSQRSHQEITKDIRPLTENCIEGLFTRDRYFRRFWWCDLWHKGHSDKTQSAGVVCYGKIRQLEKVLIVRIYCSLQLTASCFQLKMSLRNSLVNWLLGLSFKRLSSS